MMELSKQRHVLFLMLLLTEGKGVLDTDAAKTFMVEIGRDSSMLYTTRI